MTKQNKRLKAHILKYFETHDKATPGEISESTKEKNSRSIPLIMRGMKELKKIGTVPKKNTYGGHHQTPEYTLR